MRKRKKKESALRHVWEYIKNPKGVFLAVLFIAAVFGGFMISQIFANPINTMAKNLYTQRSTYGFYFTAEELKLSVGTTQDASIIHIPPLVMDIACDVVGDADIVHVSVVSPFKITAVKSGMAKITLTATFFGGPKAPTEIFVTVTDGPDAPPGNPPEDEHDYTLSYRQIAYDTNDFIFTLTASDGSIIAKGDYELYSDDPAVSILRNTVYLSRTDHPVTIYAKIDGKVVGKAVIGSG
jgi:hypothetical protein